jgi:hypothetical protein
MARLVGAGLWFVTVLVATAVKADSQMATPSDERLAAAQRRFPRGLVAGPDADRVFRVVDRPYLYCRGPVEVLKCQPELFTWLVDHPQWVAVFWRTLGMPVWSVEPTADGFVCRDGDDISVRFYRVCECPELRVFYCEGHSRGVLPATTMSVQLVLVYRYRFVRETDRRYYAVQQLEAFVSADNLAMQSLLRLGRSAWESTLERCLLELSLYFSAVCRLIERYPGWALEVAHNTPDQFPSADAQELQRLVNQLPTSPSPPHLPAEFSRRPKQESADPVSKTR